MAYSRGYEVTTQGAWSRWTCLREACGKTATERGDQHDDAAAWEAAAHQEKAHRAELLSDAAEALDTAAEALSGLWDTVTHADTHHHPGPACVRPMDATAALRTWADQLKALSPDADEWVRRAARDGMCKHETRSYTSNSWPVLMGFAEVGDRANPEVPR
ncbi:hypothetical protein [Streptomyces albidoflavus]|uniref:hypothetical protein n=1 Tax=Streptomyces albidoflavus TaxID=1886 RepID=UPI0034117602